MYPDIRRPEELSLLRPVEEKKKKKKDKDLTEEIYDLTEVPLTSGTPHTLQAAPVKIDDSQMCLLKNVDR